MAKVYPNAAGLDYPTPALASNAGGAVALTVWRKSLLFNCRGFTVFDFNGDLVFRVDNYTSRSKTEIVLMDAAGNPLFTARRKRLSLRSSWTVYNGEEAVNPRFTVRKHVSLHHSKTLAHVTPTGDKISAGDVAYEVEGSYAQRCCAVYGEGRRLVAETRLKEGSAGGVTFGSDVFRLVVEPGFDVPAAMVILILIDRLF